MLRVAARLPDALVGLAPDGGRALRLRLDDRPQPPRQALAATGVEQDRVERRAEDVVLALVERAVADPHRAARRRTRRDRRAWTRVRSRRPSMPYMICSAPSLVGLEVGDELHELLGLPVEVEEVQRLEREGRVADPGEAVVPVALAAGRLGQRGRRRGDGRAGRHVGEALDRQRRALDRVAPAVVGHPRRAHPAPPEPDRRRHALVRLVGRSAGPRGPPPRRARRRPARPAPSEWRARTQSPSMPSAMSVCSRIVRSAAGGVGGVAVVADERPLRGRAAVVEVRLADQLHLDVAVEAQDRAHEHVVGVVVGRRPGVRGDRVLAAARTHRQRVAHEQPSRSASSTSSRGRSSRARRCARSGR